MKERRNFSTVQWLLSLPGTLVLAMGLYVASHILTPNSTAARQNYHCGCYDDVCGDDPTCKCTCVYDFKMERSMLIGCAPKYIVNKTKVRNNI